MLNTGNMEICIPQVTEGLDCYSGHDDSVSCWQITIITVYLVKSFNPLCAIDVQLNSPCFQLCLQVYKCTVVYTNT